MRDTPCERHGAGTDNGLVIKSGPRLESCLDQEESSFRNVCLSRVNEKRQYPRSTKALPVTNRTMHLESRNKALEPKQDFRCNAYNQTVFTYSSPMIGSSREMLNFGLLLKVRSLGRVGRLLSHLTLSECRRLLVLVCLERKIE